MNGIVNALKFGEIPEINIYDFFHNFVGTNILYKCADTKYLYRYACRQSIRIVFVNEI